MSILRRSTAIGNTDQMDPVHTAVISPAENSRLGARSAVRSVLVLTLAITVVIIGCGKRPAAEVLLDSHMIDSTAYSLMKREHVQGLALAVINNGEVAHVAAFGIRNAAGDPLTTLTIMYGASLTKTAFTYLVMELVDEGRLDLDASIAGLLPRPLPEYDDYHDLAGDPRWKALTMRILLTHTSGFANFRWLEDDGKRKLPRRLRHSGAQFSDSSPARTCPLEVG